MSTVGFDIETYRNVPEGLYALLTAGVTANRSIKDPVKIAANLEAKKERILEKAALSPLTSRVVSIAAAVKVEGKTEWDMVGWVAERASDELRVLEKFDSWLMFVGCHHLVTYNGKRFDVPFTIARQALHGLETEYKLPTSKYDRNHTDLLDFFPGGLKPWSERAFGDSAGPDGKDVDGMVKRKEFSKLLKYNQDDVWKTVKLYSQLAKVIL